MEGHDVDSSVMHNVASGISSFENVMTSGIDTLATMFTSLLGVINMSTKDFLNMPLSAPL